MEPPGKRVRFCQNDEVHETGNVGQEMSSATGLVNDFCEDVYNIVDEIWDQNDTKMHPKSSLGPSKID